MLSVLLGVSTHAVCYFTIMLYIRSMLYC